MQTLPTGPSGILPILHTSIQMQNVPTGYSGILAILLKISAILVIHGKILLKLKSSSNADRTYWSKRNFG